VKGDSTSAADVHGKALPWLAQVAMQGGAYAAKSILRKVKGQPPLPPFRYFDKGSLAVIGRAAAVANVFEMHLSGFLAWLVWVFIHMMYLVTFQSRLQVFVQWAIQDITFNRGARLITGIAPRDFNFNREVSRMHNSGSVNPEPVTSPRAS
jgi:NADH dehydrogenase